MKKNWLYKPKITAEQKNFEENFKITVKSFEQ